MRMGIPRILAIWNPCRVFIATRPNRDRANRPGPEEARRNVRDRTGTIPPRRRDRRPRSPRPALGASIDNDDSRDLDQLSVSGPPTAGAAGILVAIAQEQLDAVGRAFKREHPARTLVEGVQADRAGGRDRYFTTRSFF